MHNLQLWLDLARHIEDPTVSVLKMAGLLKPCFRNQELKAALSHMQCHATTGMPVKSIEAGIDNVDTSDLFLSTTTVTGVVAILQDNGIPVLDLFARRSG